MHTIVPNEQAVIRFKQRINYPAIVQHIGDDKKVLMEWPKILKKIKISSASVWESYNLSSNILRKNHATISGYFENGKKGITIDMHVFTNVSNQFVIEEAMLLTGYSSMQDVNYKYFEDGPGEFYIYRGHRQKNM
ncbi:hypothetical protein MNBD_GAMMA10-1750, partial [hydrothermal vent metagenome]